MQLSQSKIVLHHLAGGAELDTLTARDLYGILNLSSIVHRLRKDGHRITGTRRICGKLDTLRPRRISVYRLNGTGGGEHA